MSKKIRIKNDIRVSWGITANGNAVELSSYNLSVKLVVFNQVIPISNYTVSYNVITFTFSGSSQTRCGAYTLVCQYTDENGGLHTIDKTEAFVLVPHTSEEGGTNNPKVALEVVQLATDIDSSTIGKAATIRVGEVTTLDATDSARVSNIGTANDAILNFYIPRGKNGLSAYEVAKNNGFSGTVSEWLASLKGNLKSELASLNDNFPSGKGFLYYDGSSWSFNSISEALTKDSLAAYITENGLATQAWVNTQISNAKLSGGGTSSGGGVSQSELQAAIKNAMKGYSWWGRKFGDGTAISGNIEGVNTISFRNTAATITKKLSLDANGNLCFDGNFYATGGITALGQSSISGGTSGGANLAIVKTVGETATTLTTAAKKLNFIYPDTWGNIIQNAGDDEVNIHLDLLPTSGGASSGTTTNPLTIYNSNGVGWKFNGSTALGLKFGDGLNASVSNDVITVKASGSGSSSGSLPYKFYVKCNDEMIGSGYDGSNGMAINLKAGNGVSLSYNEDIYYNKTIIISATGSGGSTSGNVQLNNMLFFYGSETAGGTPSVKGGYDNSGKIYLKFQGNGVTVSKGTTLTNGDTTIVNIPGDSGSSSSSVSWSDITGKPSTFTPSSHTHTASDITNFTSAVQAVKVTSASKADTLTTARTIWGQSFNGSANVTGTLSSVADINLTGSVKWTSGTSYSNGSIELYYSTPYIDFHYNKSTSDYTARLIADGENLLSFLTKSGTGIFDIQNNKLKIGNGYLVWDDTNKAFRMTSSNGGNCNFYCDGGITALGVQSTTTSGSDFSFRNVTADCFNVVKKDTSNILYFTKGYEEFSVNYDSSNNLRIDCSNLIYVNSAKIDPDGWVYSTEFHCDENGTMVLNGCEFCLGDNNGNDAEVFFYHNNNAYKLDMSKAISLGMFTQLSTQELSTLEARTKKKVSA